MGLKIAVITPWKVRCGIFTYTENLVNALKDLEVESYIVKLPRFGSKTKGLLQLVATQVPVDKIDLIHIQHEYGLYKNLEKPFYVELKRLGKPILTTMHATGMPELDDIVADLSDRVIVHNEFCAKRFGHPCFIIPHGCLSIDRSKCPPPDECKKTWGIDPRAPLVGYVGFISRGKNLKILVEAMTKVKGAGLVIGGGWHVAGSETDYISKLKKWSLEVLPARCQWLGFIPDEKLSRAYGAMTIVVYPSRFITESGALLMALSHGKAVIAWDNRPVREKKKQGALTTFKSVRGLTRKIKELLKDEDLRAELEKGAWEYAEKTSWSAVAKLHVSFYEDTLKKNSRNRG